MEINRVNAPLSFCALYGDVLRIMKELGKDAMKVVLAQKKNDVGAVIDVKL